MQWRRGIRLALPAAAFGLARATPFASTWSPPSVVATAIRQKKMMRQRFRDPVPNRLLPADVPGQASRQLALGLSEPRPRFLAGPRSQRDPSVINPSCGDAAKITLGDGNAPVAIDQRSNQPRNHRNLIDVASVKATRYAGGTTLNRVDPQSSTTGLMRRRNNGWKW